ncbi:MAG: hypothetical protein Q8Q35_03585 [Nanoarchaeota archaeon]|nr:hypothetical protein [Nanoarchaeota archaeon]
MLDKLKSFLKEIGEVKDKYLVSCFIRNTELKIDFYSSEKHKIFTYSKKGEDIIITEDEIFQKEKQPLEKLDLEKIKVSYEEALDKVKEEKDNVITILQVIDDKIVWNMTVLTPTLELYNLKVDAITGEILNEYKENFMNFRAKSQ